MLIKSADDRSSDLATLRSLIARPDVSNDTKKKIEQEMRNIQSGSKGERDAAYEIDFHFGPSKNWAVIHDIRLVHEGRIAQIDHLLINRLLEVWVGESKRFAEGISISDQGECLTFWNGKAQGIASPYEQNKKHIVVLKALCDSGVIDLPRRIGFALKPDFKSLIIASKNARVSRPKSNGWWTEGIVKADQVQTQIKKSFDDNTSTLALAKVVGSETLESFARSLVALHHPISFDWRGKFGIALEPARFQPPSPAEAQVTEAQKVAVAEPDKKPKSKLVCHTCAEPVPYNVAKFCWFNKPRFGGNIYCINCQQKAPTNIPAS